MAKDADLVTKIVSTGIAFAASWAVQKAISAAWRGTTGHDVPGDDDDFAPVVEVVLAAAITGVAVALARRYAMRSATKLVGQGRAA